MGSGTFAFAKICAIEGISLVRIRRRLAATALATAAAAAGLVFTGATPAVAATIPSTFILGPEIMHAGCEVSLFSARLSASRPAEVFASVDSTNPGHACTAFVERSVVGKTAWTVASAKVTVPSVRGLEGIANTGLVHAGQGFKSRGCVQPGGSKTAFCTAGAIIAKGSGTATSPALAPVYVRKQAEVVLSSGGICGGVLTSTTTAKKAGAKVVGLIVASAAPCTAWVQSTANGGKTWQTVSPVVPVKGPASPGVAAAFTAHYADGPGRLARICVEDTASKKRNCSGTW